ncbi:MAG: OFA family MFS transporter [Firmicutes bacterium]|nr:OFA family MFS transporter [Bacillota bacterium]
MKISGKRAGVVVATVCIQLTIGIAYIWSAFQGGITEGLFAGNNALAGLTFSLLLASLTISSVFGGKLATRFSTRAVIIAGGIMVAIGFFSASFVTYNTRWLLWLTYGVIGGAGMGFTYTPSLACVQKWFPHKKGLITGVVVTALGLGTVIFTPLVEFMIYSFNGINFVGINTGESLTFMILAGVFLVFGVVGGIFMQNPPEGYADFVNDKLKEKLKQCEKCDDVLGAKDAVAHIEGEHETEAGDDCEACPKPIVYAFHPPIKRAKRPKLPEFVPRNLNATQMLKTPYYYLMTAALMLACINGLMVINFARPIAYLRGFRDVAFVAILAVGLSNSGGRILWGAISDKLGRLNTMFILLGSTALFAPFIVIVPGGGVFAIIALIGLCYGGILAIFPAFTAEVFGVKNLATNYGFVLLGFGVGAIVASQIAGVFANSAMPIYEMCETYGGYILVRAGDITKMLPAFLIAMVCAFASAMLMMTIKIMNNKRKIKLYIRALGDKWKEKWKNKKKSDKQGE